MKLRKATLSVAYPVGVHDDHFTLVCVSEKKGNADIPLLGADVNADRIIEMMLRPVIHCSLMPPPVGFILRISLFVCAVLTAYHVWVFTSSVCLHMEHGTGALPQCMLCRHQTHLWKTILLTPVVSCVACAG